MYFLLLLKTFGTHIKCSLQTNYLISSLNRTENTAHYSINNEAGVLH